MAKKQTPVYTDIAGIELAEKQVADNIQKLQRVLDEVQELALFKIEKIDDLKSLVSEESNIEKRIVLAHEPPKLFGRKMREDVLIQKVKDYDFPSMEDLKDAVNGCKEIRDWQMYQITRGKVEPSKESNSIIQERYVFYPWQGEDSIVQKYNEAAGALDALYKELQKHHLQGHLVRQPHYSILLQSEIFSISEESINPSGLDLKRMLIIKRDRERIERERKQAS